MDDQFNALNRLRKRYQIVTTHIEKCGSNPLLAESQQGHLEAALNGHENYMKAVLPTVYDDCCEDSQTEVLENYWSGNGKTIQSEDFPDEDVSVKLQSNPLPFALTGNKRVLEEIQPFC